MRNGRKKIGTVCVDSGQLMIVDPCYLSRWTDGEFMIDDQGAPPANSYDECCKATLSDTRCGQVVSNLGIVFASGYGDGEYPVTATYEDGRIVSISISMR